MGTDERFAASQTFVAVFGQANQPFWGGGLQVVLRDRVWVELAASQVKKSGHRAFRTNGQNFDLGIPLSMTMTPFEVTGGLRFHRWTRLVPYVGGGYTSYRYRESSDFADAEENLDTRRGGPALTGGVEFRLHRWFGVGFDAQYTHVPGIFGNGGVSREAGETDLGGIGLRLKFIVGQ